MTTSNQLFIEVSSEQQEMVAGGFTVNFGETGFSGANSITTTTTTTNPDGTSSTQSGTNNVTVQTGGIVFAGLNLTENEFDSFSPNLPGG
ncbi:CTB family bacteriocin [Nodularia harveyana UHCC-0300]|uniref:CTB family bacteriocin n=1 Tax=Nodularia harveyana UHCC-0300 TaxID=2974287 RepID=A0ABU5U9Y1_9CYAN|nr:CTB family bacteriocin [Nodularia harveyana]MEA5579771.1 CTB family bacteriocin [Nodularia harveyana UHCC-0300]